MPVNGFVNIAFAQGSDLILGSNVTFHCEDGFEVCGENLLTCQADGEWNYPYPDCKRKTMKLFVITFGRIFILCVTISVLRRTEHYCG